MIKHKRFLTCTPLLLVSLSSCTFQFGTSSSTKSNDSLISSGNSEISTDSSVPTSTSVSSSQSSSFVDSPYVPNGYHLSWSDEFAGTNLDESTWSYQIGNGDWGWGNGESEYYTSDNDTVTDGNLLISAKKEVMGGQAYTSSRIRTKGKVSTTYGYVEGRIKLPAVQGLWPAFWMMPEGAYSGLGWPGAGEIDIMENRGRVSNITSGALHYASDGLGNTHTYKTAEHQTDSIENWHVYAVLWTAESISWYVDGASFLTVSRSTWNAGYATGDSAPFKAPFYIILNLAVGGQFDGNRLPPSGFEEASMAVDYVRIYAQ